MVAAASDHAMALSFARATAQRDNLMCRVAPGTIISMPIMHIHIRHNIRHRFRPFVLFVIALSNVIDSSRRKCIAISNVIDCLTAVLIRAARMVYYKCSQQCGASCLQPCHPLWVHCERFMMTCMHYPYQRVCLCICEVFAVCCDNGSL